MLWKGTSAVVLQALSCCIGSVYGQTGRRAQQDQAQQDQALVAVRQYAVNYARSLPDYICTRVTSQSIPWVMAPLATSSGIPEESKESRGTGKTEIQEELSATGGKEHYKVLKIDDDVPFSREARLADLKADAISVSEFGSVLDRIFEPDAGTTFHFLHSEKLRGRLVVVFSYDVPDSHGARVRDRAAGDDVVIGFKGRVFADAATNAVLRIETHSGEFPHNSEFKRIDLTLDYKTAKIGGREYVLPYGFDVQWHRQKATLTSGHPRPEESRVRAEFKDYRGFSAQSAVTGGGADSLPPSEVRSTITFGGVVAK
jgi:hypothetical protein